MIKTMKISNFTVFKDVELKFGKGLNVVVGENGTGKSHVLKLGYSILRILSEFGDKEPAKEVLERKIAEHLIDIFRPNSLGRLASRTQGTSTCTVEMSWGEKGILKFTFTTRNTEKVSIINFFHEKLKSSSLFIPTKEIISVFPGFQGALENRELTFDGTYLDLSKALQIAPLKGPKFQDVKNLISPIENILNATVEREHDGFYFKSQKRSGGKLESQLIAEGHRKIGMLAYLICNGSVRQSSSLFWDEPEANINPKILAILANVIVDISNIMQVTIATHSLFLLREFEILQQKRKLNTTKYFGLYFNDSDVIIEQGNDASSIGDIAALDVSIEQADRYFNLN